MSHFYKFGTKDIYDEAQIVRPAVSLVGNEMFFDPVFNPPTENGVYIKYTDGSYSAGDKLIAGKTPVGVAFKNNLVAFTIHPDEGGKIWTQNTDTVISGVTTTTDVNVAKVDYKGKDNTDAVLASGLVNNNSAFYWATKLAFKDHSRGWLPSCGEMEQIRLNAEDINAAMELIGGTPVDFSSKYYWSSTQYSAGGSWRWDTNLSSWANGLKNRNLFCRSVSAF